MGRTIRKSLAVTAVASVAIFSAACGADETTGSSSSTPADSEAMASGLVGPGCDDYAEAVPSGAGSVEGMAQDPVATAASNNPLLKTLVAAVSGQLNPKVDLVDTLNQGEFTVFAPVDDAFAKLPASAVKDLAKPANADALSGILTYHVISGQLSPDELAGSQETVQGDMVEVTGSPDELMVNGATVICGGVETANATVYLIDSVLMPPSMS